MPRNTNQLPFLKEVITHDHKYFYSSVKKVLLTGLAPMLLLAGCNTATPAQNTTEPVTEPVIEESTTTDITSETETRLADGEVQIVEVEGGSFYYKPNEIRVRKGQPVKITLNSVDAMHDLVIDELDVKTEIVKSGESTEVEFTPNEVGDFEFYCSVGQHRANGMVGTLIVEE
jgi:cytochrome c oxidase subunit 2